MRARTLLHLALTLFIGASDAFLSPLSHFRLSHRPKALQAENQFWDWRGQKIRYISDGLENEGAPCILFVHGLFVNADHWRKNIPALAAEGYRTYAVDLLGNGYSSKPSPCGPAAKALTGENNRPYVATGMANVKLGTASGGMRQSDVALAHPLGSCYNFYTWAEQLVDFADEVIKPGDGKLIIVANSIGTMSTLQAAIDRPNLVDGVFVINPNFRELHVAESPGFIQPAVRAVQGFLRANGQPLFDSLAKPGTVKNILMEPYAVKAAVTDELVDVLLTPLLQPGSADVVFDTLSYSAGPLPEQQLQDAALVGGPGSGTGTAVEVCYGALDPWTPGPRVAALDRYAPVRRVTKLDGVGHCPHDEAPELVNPLVADFAKRIVAARGTAAVS